MATIQDCLKQQRTGPYSKSLKVRVVGQGELLKYRTNGEERQCLTVAVSDGETCAKVLAYDPTKLKKLTVENSLVLRDVIVKQEEGKPLLVLTRQSKVFLTQQVDIPEDHYTEGDRIVNPPPALTVSVRDALSSPQKKKVSIAGKIIQEEQERTVRVQGEEVPIKTITLEDQTGSAKVTVWRNSINREVRTGDYVSVSDVVINSFKNETSLSTTTRSSIKKTEAPLTTETIKIQGISLEGGNAELLLEMDEILHVCGDLLATATGEANLEELTKDGVVEMCISRRGTDICSLTLI